MRLRTIFLVYAIGIICVPVSIAPLIRLLVAPGPGDASDAPPGVFRIVAAEKAVHRAVRIDDDGTLSPARGYSIPDWLDLVVVSRSGTVVSSSIPEFPIGSTVEEADLGRIRGAAMSGTRVVVQRITEGGATIGAFAARFAVEPLELGDDPARPFVFAAYLLCLAAAVLGVSWIFGARLASSFQRLERAAERIASGDLEGRVSVKGSAEMRALAGAMDRMRGSLADDRSRRNRFLASVSHDLRTPLTSVRGYIEALEDGVAEDGAAASRYLSIMKEKTAALSDRIDELLDFARMGTGEWRLKLAELDLGSWLASACAEYREDARAAGKTFAASVGEAEGARVRADSKMLKRAFENAFTNALRYTPPGRSVYLRARRESGTVELSFEDSGPGIPEEELPRIFDPYFRGSGSRGEGEGLGLAIAKAIIADHGWSMRAESREGGGTALTFRLGPPADAIEPGKTRP